MIDDIVTGIIGGYLADRLGRRFLPPKATSSFDYISREDLRRRNHWIEIVGAAIWPTAMLLIFIGLLNFGLNQNPWRIGLLFGFPIALTLAFVCAVTLPKGLPRFREFWRYHELKNGIRLAALLALYVPLAIIGVIGLAKSF
jgi:MFS family permease